MPTNAPFQPRWAPASSAVGAEFLAPGIAALIVVIGFFPRSTAAIFLGILVVTAAAALARGRFEEACRRAAGPLLWSGLAFAGWSMASALWSSDPLASLTKPMYLAAAVSGLAVAASVVPTLERATLERLSSGVLIGLLLAGLVLALETVTDQAPTRFFYNAFPSLQKGLAKQLTIVNGLVTAIEVNNINRRATVVTLLLIPAGLIAGLSANKATRRAGLAGVALIAATLLGFSSHQSSQAAIVAGALAFVLARLWPRAALGLTAAGWCAACLLVVPMVTALHATNLHKEPQKLFFSARNRIVIWNYTAEQIRKAPVLGVGADATAKMNEEFNRTLARAPVTPDQRDGEFLQGTARHAHNVYLQVWYELGGVGALLFTALGLCGLAAIRRAPAGLQPFLVAEFAAIATMIAFSFSLWQVWLQGAIGVGILALCVASDAWRTRGAQG